MTEDQINWWKLRETAKEIEIMDSLRLKDWVAINQVSNGALSLADWIGADSWSIKWGLDPLVQRAVIVAADVVAQEIKSKRDQQMLEMKANAEYKPLPAPTIGGSNLSNYLR